MEGPGRLQSMGSLESDTTERLHFHFPLSCIGEGNGNPLQCSCLENPRDREAWWAAVNEVAQSRAQLKWLRSSSNLDLANHFHSFCSGNYHRRNLHYQNDWLQYKFMISNLSWASLAAQQPFCSSLVGSLGLPRWFSGKESTCSAGVAGLIPGLGRSPGERNVIPLQYSCMENAMDRGAWQATVHGVAKELDMT